MRQRRRRIAALAAFAVLALLIGAGAWVLFNVRECRLLARSAALGDAEVRRDAAGRCYLCRREGWLYDIAFRTCRAGDRVYAPAPERASVSGG